MAAVPAVQLPSHRRGGVPAGRLVASRLVETDQRGTPVTFRTPTADETQWVWAHVLTDALKRSHGVIDEPPADRWVCACQYGRCSYCQLGRHEQCATRLFPVGSPTHGWVLRQNGSAIEEARVYAAGRQQCVWRCPCCGTPKLGQLALL